MDDAALEVAAQLRCRDSGFSSGPYLWLAADVLLSVVLPSPRTVRQVENLRQLSSFTWSGTTVRVWRGVVEGLDTTFLEPENGMFWVGCIYGRNNDAQRWVRVGKEGREPGQAGQMRKGVLIAWCVGGTSTPALLW